MDTTTDTPAQVRILADGPYQVSASLPLDIQRITPDDSGQSQQWAGGERLPAAAESHYLLCRCGHSRRKPYCDGSHRRVGFSGTETACREGYLSQAAYLQGPRMSLTDLPALCSGAGFCSPHGSVWRQLGQTDDVAVAAQFSQQVELCPSGRLRAWLTHGRQSLEPSLVRAIGLVEDPQHGVSGPLWLRGGVPLVGADGRPYEVRNRMALCRCGASRNKPFCDGSHQRTALGFDDGLINQPASSAVASEPAHCASPAC